MQYLLMLYRPESHWGTMTRAEQEQTMGAYQSFTEALRQADVLRASNRLQPVASATTVRIANGKPQVLDGPFVDSKEQLGGYYLIDVPNLDAAIAWAGRCPGASHGTIEVRPVWVV
jgi:hypothetical protein